MRVLGIPIAFAMLAACAAQQVEVAAPATAQTVICEQVITFDSEQSRASFLDVNAERIVAHAATETVYFSAAESGPGLSIVSNVASCPAEGLTATLALHGEFGSRQSMVNAEDVFARMTRAAFAAVDALGDAPRQCVVRASQIQDNDAFGISGRLLFAGLRGVQVTGHDEAVYVAAAEDCALVAKFAAAAFNNLHGLAPALIACPSATLYTCGDP